jgi:hypothetical protein
METGEKRLRAGRPAEIKERTWMIRRYVVQYITEGMQ